MSISIAVLADFKKLFTGNINAYGVHEYNFVEKGKKEKGKSYTQPYPVTEKLYKEHLEGIKGLGIIPIILNKCNFAAIDIDIYDKDISYFVDMIYRYNLPLLPFKTKSGGLHLFMFFKEPIKASKARKVMTDIILLLGLKNKTEIFPKQSTLSNKQTGSWINLPYYNAKETRQYLIKNDGSACLIEEAIIEINKKLQTEESILDYLDSIPLNDAPPCLQSIYLRGITDYRNNYLFSLAGYFKVKYGDDFEFKITDANNSLVEPLPIDELSKTIITTHKKKDYSYKCNEEPISNLCNKQICKKRKYGIGGDEVSQLSFEDFIQYTTDPPYYEWIINKKSLKFYSELDIIQQQKFRVLCFRILHILPYKLKDLTWTKIVNRALENIIIKNVAIEDDISPGAMFKEYLTEFFEQKTLAKTKEQILLDRVYKDERKKVYIFKPKNLLDFLVIQKQFRLYGFTKIQAKLREMDSIPKRYYINKEIGSIRVWLLPFTGLSAFLKEKDKIDKFDIDFKEDYKDKPF